MHHPSPSKLFATAKPYNSYSKCCHASYLILQILIFLKSLQTSLQLHESPSKCPSNSICSCSIFLSCQNNSPDAYVALAPLNPGILSKCISHPFNLRRNYSMASIVARELVDHPSKHSPAPRDSPIHLTSLQNP